MRRYARDHFPRETKPEQTANNDTNRSSALRSPTRRPTRSTAVSSRNAREELGIETNVGCVRIVEKAVEYIQAQPDGKLPVLFDLLFVY